MANISAASSTDIKVSDVSLRYLLTSQLPKTVQELVMDFLRMKRIKRVDFWALRNVSFELQRGESLGIIGENGAGKSTLLKVLAGVFEPTQGKVRVNRRILPMIELGAGFDAELTGRENIYLSTSILGFPRKEINSKFKSIVEFSELGEFIYSPVKTYSSGMIARLAFSIATETNPEILFVDEVLSVGDEKFRHKCYERMSSLVDKGITLIFVSHSMPEIERLCRKTLWLEHGRIKAMGDTAEITREYLAS